MGEFDLIAALLEELRGVTDGADIVLGPGDDCSVSRTPEGHDLVSSIDSLVGGVHFPSAAAPELVGFRAMCVSFSDVAAMGARPAFATIAVTLPDDDEAWLRGFAAGAALAARRFGAAIVGGNLACGPLNVTMSVHGSVPAGQAVRRTGANAGDLVCVSGPVGWGAVARERVDFPIAPTLTDLLSLDADEPDFALRRYFAPEPDFALAGRLPGVATAAIDVSDGLLADLGHLCEASGTGARVDLEQVPCAGDVSQAVVAGDDYVLVITLPEGALDPLRREFPALTVIGVLTEGVGLAGADGRPLGVGGYDHFGAR